MKAQLVACTYAATIDVSSNPYIQPELSIKDNIVLKLQQGTVAYIYKFSFIITLCILVLPTIYNGDPQLLTN